MANVLKIYSQAVLATTNTELEVAGDGHVTALSATNKHTSNAIVISVYAFPTDNARSATDEEHLIWHSSLAASSTQIFELTRGSINFSKLRLTASASAGTDVTLTVFGI